MQVRSDLTWRDLQYLAMDTAKPVADTDAAWQKTAIGKQFRQSRRLLGDAERRRGLRARRHGGEFGVGPLGRHSSPPRIGVC